MFVRSTAENQIGETVADWVRWVLVRKQDSSAPAPEASKPATTARGDLFDDQEDADLEIPSFLRKKKTG